jgi:hypothetical protein
MPAVCPIRNGAQRMIENTYTRLVDMAEQSIKHTSSLGYGFSVGTLVAQAIPFIDKHSWVIGLFGILLTWLTNIFFRIIDQLNKPRKR